MTWNILHVASISCLLWACIAAEDQHSHSWHAAGDDPGLRRLAATVARQTFNVTVNVLQFDSFGSDSSRLDVSFEGPLGKMVKAYFPGTDGNAARHLPTWLVHGMSMRISGYWNTSQIPGSPLATQESVGAPAQDSELQDTRTPFVVDSIRPMKSPDRTLLDIQSPRGNAPYLASAVVVPVVPCGTGLSHSSKDQLTRAVFGTTAGGYSRAMLDCSRGKVLVNGVVKDPVYGCPSSKDAFAIFSLVQNLLSSDPDWAGSFFKVMILPDSWLQAIGVATVGGSLSWFQDSFTDQPGLFLHELGHNWRLHHAAGPFASQEYADTSSVMGYCCANPCFHFLHSWQLGFASYKAQLQLSDILMNKSSVSIDLPELGTTDASGLQILGKLPGAWDPAYPAYLVISYRGLDGFDSQLLGSGHEMKVFVHRYDGQSESDVKMTFLLHELREGATVVVQDTDTVNTRVPTLLKITVKGASGPTATVLLCKALSSDLTSAVPCSDPPPAPLAPPVTLGPPRLGPPARGGIWCSWFTGATDSIQAMPTGLAMIGLGCSGTFCATMKADWRPDVAVNAEKVETRALNPSTGLVLCRLGQVVTQLTCQDTDCDTFNITCGFPIGGSMSAKPVFQAWFPQTLHGVGLSQCGPSSLLVGVACSRARCGQAMLYCDEFLPDTLMPCRPQCADFHLTCGDDGCGGSCGNCSGTTTCSPITGTCATLTETDWVTSGISMTALNMAAAGMGCRGRYCTDVQLRLLDIQVDAKATFVSDWISDGAGGRWGWNPVLAGQVADCPRGTVISLLECDGSFCRNLRFKCAKPLNWVVDLAGEPFVTNWFSDEDERRDCPSGQVLIGIECMLSQNFPCAANCNDYCDTKRLRCRPIQPQLFDGSLLSDADADEGSDDNHGNGFVSNQDASPDPQSGSASQVAPSFAALFGLAASFRAMG